MTKIKIIEFPETYEAPKIEGAFKFEALPMAEKDFHSLTPEGLKGALRENGMWDAEGMKITPDLSRNLGVRYSDLALVPISQDLQITVKDYGALGLLKSALVFIGKKLMEALQYPSAFGGPFVFMIFARFLISDSKNPDVREEVIVRLDSYSDYQKRREALEDRKGEPLTVSFQGNIETKAVNSFYVDEIVTRGESRVLSGDPNIRVTTTAFAENSALPDRGFIPGPRFMNPRGVEEVNGYRLRAGPPGEEAEVLIRTNDRSIVEEIHQQIVAGYRSTGSAQAAIDGLIYRSPWDPSLFEIPGRPLEAFPLPPALTPIVMRDHPQIAERTRQVKTEDLPAPVAELVKSLFEVNKLDEYEHAGIALRLGDGAFSRRGGYFGGDITSWETKKIVDNEGFRSARGFLLGEAVQAAKKNANLFQQPITLYYYHTHPYRKPTGLTETPIYPHEDGRTYTLTNETDAIADDRYLEHMTRLLREAGFTGTITLEAGAIPTRKGKKDALYIASYFPPAVPGGKKGP